MANKLYVGNLQWKIGFEQLQELFSQAGQVVSATVISDRYTGRSKGFGFIEMSTDEEAQKAKEMFNGKEFEGRVMVVNDAKPKRDDDASGQAPVDDQGVPADDQAQPAIDPTEPTADDIVGAPVGEVPVEEEPMPETEDQPEE